MRNGESVRASDVSYLPIVSAFARTIGVVEEVDRLCGHKNGISPSRIVLALMVDALSGRTPLFRLPQAFAKLDMELLLGEAISPEKLNDDAVGRALDCIFDVGTGMRVSLKASNSKVVGCNNRHTSSHLLYDDHQVCVGYCDTNLRSTLDPIQERYLQILGLSTAVFTNPSVSLRPDRASSMQRPRGLG